MGPTAFLSRLFPMLAATTTLLAQDTLQPDPAEASRSIAPHAIHLELGTLLVNNDLSASYEYRLAPSLAVRAGGVAGVAFEHGGAAGGFAMGTLFVGGESSLELGLGVSLMDWSPGGPLDRSGFHVRPAFSAGYRYQPSKGGVLIRAGVSLLVTPLPYVGIGWAF